MRARFTAGPGQPRRPLGRGSGAGLAGVQERRPWNGLWQGGDIAEHDLDDVPDRVAWIFGAPVAFQPSIDEQLKQIESERPNQQDRQ